jgi:hypothetical protein
MLLQECRPEEIMALKKVTYDATRGELRIEGGKSKAAKRPLCLCSESIEVLNRRMKLGEGPWLFPSDRIPCDHIRQLQTTHDSACQDAGLSFVIYDLRHTFATSFVESRSFQLAQRDQVRPSNRATPTRTGEALRGGPASRFHTEGEGMMTEQKLKVSWTRNWTGALTSFAPTHPEVCKTFIQRFESAPRLQQYPFK